MKGVLSAVLFLLFVVAVSTIGRANEIVIGTANQGNCYPFTCNDSGISTGESIQYQQVYSSSSFPGTVNITSESFYYIFGKTQFGGDSLIIGGAYEGFLSTTSVAIDNLSSTSLSSNLGPDDTEVFDFTVPPGGELIPSDGIFTINNNISGFTYDPAVGNLLLDVIVTNQDDVPNQIGDAFLDTDDTGTFTSRAFAFDSSDSGYADADGLVTGFGVTTPTTTIPEPCPLILIATGLLGITALLLWRRKRLFSA